MIAEHRDGVLAEGAQGSLLDVDRLTTLKPLSTAERRAITSFLEPGQSILVPQWYWGPYEIIASHTARKVETFSMFNAEGRFNLEAFDEALSAQLERQGRALFISNFPCNNPTGYSLDDEEWDGRRLNFADAHVFAHLVVQIDHGPARHVEGFLDGLEAVHHFVEVASLHYQHVLHPGHGHSLEVLDLY